MYLGVSITNLQVRVHDVSNATDPQVNANNKSTTMKYDMFENTG